MTCDADGCTAPAAVTVVHTTDNSRVGRPDSREERHWCAAHNPWREWVTADEG